LNALPPASEAGSIELRVREALAEKLFASTPPSVLGGVFFAAVVATLVAGEVPPGSAWGWFGLKAVIAAVRIVHVRRFLASAWQSGAVEIRLHTYSFWIALDALTWAAMLPLFGTGAGAAPLTLLTCGLIGIASLAVFTTVSHWPVAVLFSSMCLGTVGTWYALRGAPGDWGVTAGWAIYLVLLIIESRRGYEHLAEMLRLRFENAALAEDRAAALASAQSSDAAKSRFLAMVSHEMRTPLNGIMGMAQVLRAEIVEPARARSLELLENSARLLARIIGDLLDLARMEAGAIDVQRERINLRQTIDQVVALLQPLAQQRGLALQAHWPGDAPELVLGDGTRVGQVLHNLVGNALKFTETGRIDVRAAYVAPGSWRIDVVDTGPGITAADQRRIFEAFERVGDVGLVQGTGLGLPIARRLARAMGGDVSCDSEPGRGSTFTFTFAAPAAEAATAESAAMPPPPPDSPLTGDGAFSPIGMAGEDGDAPASVVLVVDDNEVNTLVAAALLEQLGWRHEAVGDGQQALAAMAVTRYAAVLMDCHMPVLDGWEATRRWRRAERDGRLPIIGITANATAEDRQSCLDAGMDDHLPKPFDMDDLGLTLQRLVGPAPR
jgi:signal transduction histidine kinase/ActR/RegA family two-component response regulator